MRALSGKLRSTSRIALWIVLLSCCVWGARLYSSRVVDAALPADMRPNAKDISDSELLLHTSIQKLETLEKLSADVEFEASYFGEKYFGRGRYEEATAATPFGGLGRRNPYEKTRFLLNATLSSANDGEEQSESQEGNVENFLTIVCDCDAQAWWRYSSIEGVKSLARINTEELWASIQQLDDEETATLAENGVASLNCGLNGMPGLGGLAGSLKRVDAFYQFDEPIETVQLASGEKLYKISGYAKEKFWDLARDNMKVENFEAYMIENFPTNVDIYFGVDWAFPYKIDYYSLQGDEKNPARNTVFSVRYTPNAEPIRAEDFHYDQPQSTFEHVETQYLESLIPGIRL